MSIFDRLANLVRLDNWKNLTSGVGAGLRGEFTFQRGAPLSDEELEAIFDGDSFGARVCDAYPEHALRQGVRLNLGDTALETAIGEQLTRLDADAKLGAAWTWARLYGGGVVWVGANDGRDPAEPLEPRAIQSVDFLTVFDRRELTPATWNDDTRSTTFGEPETYRFTRVGYARVDQRRVHASRLLRFDGALTSRPRRRANHGWSNSELQRVYSRLQMFNGAYESVFTLLQDSSQGIFKLKNLYEMMAGDRDDYVKKRIALMDTARSVARSIMVDADEEDYSRVEASFAGIPDALDRFLVLLAGASGIPVTILMGQAPAGLNATGDSDVRSFYDRVQSARAKVLAPRYLRLVRALCLARSGPTGGVLPQRVALTFPSLYQLTPSEEADLRNKQAMTDQVYLQTGVLTPEEVGINRFRREGWSAETTIELEAREKALEADAAAGALTSGDGAAVAEHAEGIRAVVASVAGREMPRDAGVGQLVALFGLTPEKAEQAMGEAGRSYFTTPEPAHVAELDSLRSKARSLEASQRSAKAMLAHVLERNKRGELVVGSPIARAPTATEEGDVLGEGDVIQVPADTPEGTPVAPRADGRYVRADGGDGTGVAVVLPVPPDVAARIAVPGGELPGDLHLTLAYLGRMDELPTDARARVCTVVAAWALAHAPLVGALAGQGRFLSAEGLPEPVYLSPDCPALTSARERLAASLAAVGVPARAAHGFVPHVTVAYAAKGAPAPDAPAEPVPVTFTHVGLWWGPRREALPLAARPVPELDVLEALTLEAAA